MILALDTSTALASVALYDGAVAAAITWRSGRHPPVGPVPPARSRVAPARRAGTRRSRARGITTGATLLCVCCLASIRRRRWELPQRQSLISSER